MRRIISTVLCAVLLMTMLAACGKTQKLSAAEFLDLGEKYLAELNYEQAIVQFLGVIEVEPKNALTSAELMHICIWTSRLMPLICLPAGLKLQTARILKML